MITILSAVVLASISISSLMSLLIGIVCVGLVFWLLWWLLGYINPPEPFMKVGKVILAVIGVVILINLLMSLAGHNFINW